jgi:hypothetical protein
MLGEFLLAIALIKIGDTNKINSFVNYYKIVVRPTSIALTLELH